MRQHRIHLPLLIVSILAITSLLCGCGGGGGTSTYAIRALPADGGERGSFAYDINENGQIAGNDGDCAVVWNADGTKRVLEREGDFCSANVIDARGVVMGLIAHQETSGEYPFTWYQGAVWDSNNSCTRLGPDETPLHSNAVSSARGVSTQGEIVGDVQSKAAYWSSPAIQPVILDDAPDAGYSFASGINDSGLIVGDTLVSTPGGTRPHGAVWRNDGHFVRLLEPLPNGEASSVQAVNQSGLIVGESRDSEGKCTAVVWTSDGRISQLQGLPGCENAQALDVNDLGQIVGCASNGAYGSGMREYVAVFWDSSGRITALGALPGATDTHANAINNSGQIVGGTSVAGVSKAVIWEPSH